MNAQRQLEAMRRYVAEAKPRKLDPELKRELHRGWLLPYLLRLDDAAWGRWDHWARTQHAGRLLDEPIPQIEWTRHDAGRKMWEKCLDSVTRHGGWRGWSSWRYVDYFFDWLLFGFGKLDTLPEEPSECAGASMRLYQLFDIAVLLAYPGDYLGDMLAENAHGKHHGFFPTPMDVCAMMVRMQMAGEDCRTKTVCDPALGTGRMLLAASNHSYRLYGNDIDRTVIKATLINGYLYAPWLVKPFDFLATYQSAHEDAPMIPNLTFKQQELIPA